VQKRAQRESHAELRDSIQNRFNKAIIFRIGRAFNLVNTRFGGDGYRSVSRLTKKLRECHSIDEETVKLITKKNILNLMNWWVAEKPKVVEVKKWTCPE
jgi:hypothetical protein